MLVKPALVSDMENTGPSGGKTKEGGSAARFPASQ